MDTVEKESLPQFLFAITIENHIQYNLKNDEESCVKIESDSLTEGEIFEAEVYSEGLNNADKFIADLVDYVDNLDEPTIVYIWGDHLPALSAFNSLGFINDKYNKYGTPLIVYSNYKDIEIEDVNITPNQIATQIVKDSGIEYSSYFDFIYNLRSKYPVVHKEFGVDINDEDIKRYELLQYDLLFGEKYFLDK